MSILQIDKNHPECCAIDSQQHIENSLGSPLTLPECLQEKLTENWANQCEDDLLALFKLMTGSDYQQVHRDNTYNSENDLSHFFVFTVYADKDSPDWVWRRGCFVVVEIGSPGDPRCASYGPAQVFYLDDDTIGDSGFLDWTLGWWLEPIDSSYPADSIDWLNDRCTYGYSSNPFYELTQNTYTDPIWSEKHGKFLIRPKDSFFPCFCHPVEPCYG